MEARGLTKVYGRQRALAGVDVTLRAGQLTALIGPNGAGKSTLVGILGTLLRPSQGQVTYGDHSASAELRRQIGVLAHESLCYGDLTGRENIEFFARLYSVAAPADRARSLLERVGLADSADRPARTYSRGMMQRLSLARALVHHPALLLFDEPFAGLDRAGIDLLGAILSEERSRGAMMVVVTHDFAAVAPWVDRVVVLFRGRVAHDAAAPADRSSAALAGIYRTAVGS